MAFSLVRPAGSLRALPNMWIGPEAGSSFSSAALPVRLCSMDRSHKVLPKKQSPMPLEPTASNAECALFCVVMIIPALLIHAFRYSEDRVTSIIERRIRDRHPEQTSFDSSMVSKVYEIVRRYRYTARTVGLDYLTYLALPVAMWIGVRLMDLGYLSSLWPWPLLIGCLVMGMLSSKSHAFIQRRVDEAIDSVCHLRSCRESP